MRIRICFIIIVLLFFSDRAFAENKLIMSGHPDFNPVMYKQGTQIIGIGSELATMVFSDLGIATVCKCVGPWARVQLNGKTGEIDFIVAIFKNREREKYLDYVPTPFMDNPASIFVAKGREFKFNSWDDLIGKIGGRVRGDRYRQDFEDFLVQNNITLQAVNTIEQNFKRLLLGRIDFYPYGNYPIFIKLKKFGYQGKIVSLPVPLYVGQFYFAFSKKSSFKKYMKHVDEKVIEYKKNGTIDKLLNKYLK